MAIIATVYTTTKDGNYVIVPNCPPPPPYPTDGKLYKWDENYRYWRQLPSQISTDALQVYIPTGDGDYVRC